MTILLSPMLAVFCLESLGYKVKAWHDGERFLAQADLYSTGVLLLDIRMPQIEGTHVYAQMRERNSTLAVIFLTAHGEIPQAVEQMKLGGVDFLQTGGNGTFDGGLTARFAAIRVALYPSTSPNCVMPR